MSAQAGLGQVAPGAEERDERQRDDRHGGNRVPESVGRVQAGDEVEVHPEDAGDQRQRHEDRGQRRQRAHDLVRAVRGRGEVQLHGRLDRRLEPPGVGQHALDVFDQVVDPHLERVGHRRQQQLRRRVDVRSFGLGAVAAPVEPLVAPFLQRVELFLGQVLQFAQLAARFEQRQPVLVRAPRIEQVALPELQLVGQRLAQVEVAVDHAVEDPQHQLFGLGRQTLAELRGLEQPPADRGHEVAVGRTHRHQHTAHQEEHRRARADPDRRVRIGDRPEGEPPEHDHLVGVRRIEIRRVRRILGVEQVVFEHGDAGQLLHRLDPRAGVLVMAVDPQVAARRQPRRRRRQHLAASRLDVDEARRGAHVAVSPGAASAPRRGRNTSGCRRPRRDASPAATPSPRSSRPASHWRRRP